ncbi:MAG: RNA polymerase sigma factor [Candidatus Magasanikbacteria bacterium]
MSTEDQTRSLVEASIQGNAQAFGELYDQYVEKIYTFVFYKTSHKETAEDLTSKVFFKALKKIAQFDHEKGTFSSWLYKIARNTVIDFYRQNKKHSNIDDFWNLASEEIIEQYVDTRMDREVLQKYMAELTSEQRDIVLLRTWQGMSHREISEVLDKSEESCRMAYSRGLKKLREVMPEHLYTLFVLGLIKHFV